VECEQLIEGQEAAVYEVESILEEIEMARKATGDLKLKLGNIHDQCKEAETMVRQMKLVKVEGDELRRTEDAVTYEDECLSEETEVTRKNMGDLKLVSRKHS
jgi:hypothetical protein